MKYRQRRVNTRPREQRTFTTLTFNPTVLFFSLTFWSLVIAVDKGRDGRGPCLPPELCWFWSIVLNLLLQCSFEFSLIVHGRKRSIFKELNKPGSIFLLFFFKTQTSFNREEAGLYKDTGFMQTIQGEGYK